MCRSKLEGGRRCSRDNNARINKLLEIQDFQDRELHEVMANQREQEVYLEAKILEKERFIADTTDYSPDELEKYSHAIAKERFTLTKLIERLAYVKAIIAETKLEMEIAQHHAHTTEAGIKNLINQGETGRAKFYACVKKLQIAIGNLHKYYSIETLTARQEKSQAKYVNQLPILVMELDKMKKSDSQVRFIEGIISESNPRAKDLIKQIRSQATTGA